MATETSTTAVALTCPVCDITVNQAPGTRRTICPHCGNFYDSLQEAPARLLQQRSRRNERRSSEENQNNRSAGDRSGGRNRMRSISNFFNNIGSNENREGKNQRLQRRSGSDSPAISSSRTTPRSLSTSTTPVGDTPDLTMHLPPITNSSSLLSPTSKRIEDSSGSRASSRNNTGYNKASVNSTVVGSNRRKSDALTPDVPRHRGKTKTVEQLFADVIAAQANNNWLQVQDFYATTFDSFTEINFAFKDTKKECKSTEDPGIRWDLVYAAYDHLQDLPEEVKKTVLKANINSLLKDKRQHTKDDLRAYLILVQNPQFTDITNFVIFAHLLRQMASLGDHDHHYLVHWFKKIESSRFKKLLEKVHYFVSCRLFPPKPQDLPPMSKCSWWIPCATKVLALFNAANNLSHPTPMIPFLDFYNYTLDHLDLMAEYYTWQNPSAHPGFSFCQYPFILSISAKRTILQKDSEQQMIVMARRSLVAKVQRRQLPDIGMLFLNLNVRRAYLVSDSLNEIARKQHDLKKKLKVTFVGEAGLDMGGLTKEWFLLLVRQIFREEYGMFTYDKKAGVYWFSSSPCDNYQEFNLVGVLMGLAVYNSINLDIHFPPVCYKKLLSPAVVPYSNPGATVGICGVTIDDLEKTRPELAKGLKDLLEYEGDVEEDFCLTFMISYTEFGDQKSHTLKEGGENIAVTNKNRKEYAKLYVDYLLNKSVYNQFKAFYHGFHSVCASNALIMLRPEEVEMLVCGSPTLDMPALKKVTTYDGYTATDSTIKYFWEVVQSMSTDIQKKLLLFTTGSDRIPIGGMSEMQFKVTRVNNLEMLPMAHTCFNQLVLPAYTNRKLLKQKLLIAIQNAEGFGIE